ncbi:MAG: creatininase family protein [Trueperaceae bacterium]
MQIRDMNWMQVEDRLRSDDRAVIPLGSTEQHGYLSLCVDQILAERVATEAAEPLQVPVFPALPFGLAPYFASYPGTVSLRTSTYVALLHDLLSGVADGGARRILLVNGHGGNRAATNVALEFMNERPGVSVKWHDWWAAPDTMATVQAIDPDASHASWMENFPWTRLPGVELPDGGREMTDMTRMRALGAPAVRELLGDGNMGGRYQRSDEEMLRVWRAGVQETRDALEGPWS